MNPGMPQSGMPSGASSGAPYFNGWSPSGGFAQPQQNYGGFGYSSPYGGMSGGFGSPFDGYGGSGFGSPFGSPYGGFGGFGYSSPFGQFQTPNFAAKGGSGQLQSPTSNMPSTGQNPTTPLQPSPTTQPQALLTNMNQLPPLLGGSPSSLPHPSNQLPPSGGIPGYVGAAPSVLPPLLGGSPSRMQSPIPSQSNAPIPQAVPPQMTGAVSGPVPMGPRLPFNPNRFTGINSGLPGKNMLGGFR